MPNLIEKEYGATTALTITLDAIGNGAGRVCTLVDNETDNGSYTATASDQADEIHVFAEITSGAAAPTDDTYYKFYLIAHDDGSSPNVSTDAVGLTDSAVTVEPENSLLLFSIRVSASAGTSFFGHGVIHDPPPGWSIVFWNASGQSTHEASGNTSQLRYVGIKREVQ